MKRPLILTVLAIAAGVAVAPAIVTSADAQVPPRYGAWGDRDRDGVPTRSNSTTTTASGRGATRTVPNAYDRHDNRQQAWDRDRDGVPNRYDRFDNRQLQDRDHDGVPRAFDRNDRNPYR